MSDLRQLLPRTTYTDPAWFERERRELFDQSWTFACTQAQVGNAGDFQSLRYLDHSLFVVRTSNGELKAFHNICRHRGCEVLEGAGNTGEVIVCPYHRWAYRLDGRLRALPFEEECFGHVDRSSHGLIEASVGVYRGLVFVNPESAPRDSFDDWIAHMDEHAWPHRFDDDSLAFAGEVTYEMHCNWKIFYENAIDGYHLGYLHEKTLGTVYPDRNVWDLGGRNHVWYSTEHGGERRSNTLLSVESADGYGAPRLHGDNEATYPGVVMLFPLTILSPSPWGFYVSLLQPIDAERTNMRTMSWAPGATGGRFSFGERSEPVRLADLDGHPLDSGNFQVEDMWIVEKIQRNLRSPKYAVGPLAAGDGAETPIGQFQEQLLEFVPL